MKTNLYALPELRDDFIFSKKNNVYFLRKEVGNYVKGSAWNVVQNLKPSELFRISLSARLLKIIFPHSKIYEVLIVNSGHGHAALATMMNVDLVKFQKLDCKAEKVTFDCLNGGCNITDHGVLRGKDIQEVSTYNNLPILDFEKVFLTTLMLDTFNFFCEDFALKKNDADINVRLINLSDNFLSLTLNNPNSQGLLSVIVRDKYEEIAAVHGNDKIESALKLVEDFETNVYLRLFKNLPSEFINRLDLTRILAAASDILKNTKKLHEVMYEIASEVRNNVYGENLLRDLTLDNTQFAQYRGKILTPLILKQYLVKLIDINLLNLQKLKLCIEVETALHSNNKEVLTSYFYEELFKEDPLCLSFYRHPHQKGYLDLSQFTISKMAKTYKYQNEAADYYNSYWRGEILLPEIKPDTLIDEL